MASRKKYHKKFDKACKKLLKMGKMLFQSLIMKRSHKKTLLFIAGCQRSGTSIMSKIFKRDYHSRVYNEFSVLSDLDVHRIRLNPLPMVREQISRNKASLIVLKPLVESQNLSRLLKFFPRSRAIWLYRHYKDVAFSYITKFGLEKGLIDLQSIVENNPNNWRSEHTSSKTRELILDLFSSDLNYQDGTALFWYTRNILYFDANLDANNNIILCHYNDMVLNPGKILKHIYEFLEIKYPGDRIVCEVHPNSIGKGSHLLLTPEIEEICSGLYEKLNHASKHYWSEIIGDG